MDFMPSREELEDQAKLLGYALISYAQGNKERSLNHLEELARRAGSDITVMFMLARWITTQSVPSSNYEFFGFQLLNQKTGEALNPDMFSADPLSEGAAITWCLRFITSVGNEDQPQQHALLNATESPEQAMARMLMMLHLAGGLIKQELLKGKS